MLWVNHSWLFDLILYGLYNAAGGPGLVVAKAVVVGLLALVMVQTRRRGEGAWIAVVCTALALRQRWGRQ